MPASFQDLQQAIQSEQSDTIVRLLHESPELVSAHDNRRQTPLHVAAYSGAGDAARTLLDAGADVAARTVVGYTPLHYAAFGGHPAVFNRLLEAGADASAVDDSQTTLLHAAAAGGSLKLVEQLLALGIPPGIRNLYGESPSHRATQRNHLAVHKRLVEHGADPFPIDRYDLHLLHKSAIGGAEETTTWLLDNGHNPEDVDLTGQTPLHAAAQVGKTATVGLLADRGANVNCRAFDGSTPLHAAAAGGHREMTELLLAGGASASSRDDKGRTPLHAAAINGQLDVLPLLIEAGLSPNDPDVDDHTAVDLAAAYGQQEIGDALRQAGGSVGRIDPDPVSNLPGKAVGPGEMMVWYLGHSGWAVRTANHWLLFDYAPGVPDSASGSLVNGRVRIDELKGAPITAFVSHHHADHFDARVLEWRERGDVHLVFGWDAAVEPPCTCVREEGAIEVNGIEIHAIPATDAGSAFLVAVDGVRIYHAGDHAAASIPPEPEFAQGIDRLAEMGEGVDIAFVPVFGCGLPETDALRAGNRYTLDALHVRTVFPMHVGWTGYFYRQFEKWSAVEGLSIPLGIADQPGDRFLVRNGEIQQVWS